MADSQENGYYIATPERALCDLVYIRKLEWKGIDLLLEGFRMEHKTLQQWSTKLLERLKSQYRNKRTQTFIDKLTREVGGGSVVLKGDRSRIKGEKHFSSRRSQHRRFTENANLTEQRKLFNGVPVFRAPGINAPYKLVSLEFAARRVIQGVFRGFDLMINHRCA